MGLRRLYLVLPLALLVQTAAGQDYTVRYEYAPSGRLAAALYSGAAYPEEQAIRYTYAPGGGLVGRVDGPATGVSTEADDVPEVFALHGTYPNPFREATRFRFDVPHRARVRLTVYDLTGRRLATLLDGDHAPGRYEVGWDGRLTTGELAAGVYFFRLEADGYRETHKLVRMR